MLSQKRVGVMGWTTPAYYESSGYGTFLILVMDRKSAEVNFGTKDLIRVEIIRHGVTRCVRCLCVRDLQCAHIVGRGNYSTRFQLLPVKNAIPLCADCHDWFDKHKDDTPVFDELARPHYSAAKNSYVFLEQRCGYSWRDLQKLLLSGNQIFKGYSYKKKEIGANLRATLKELET